MRRGNRCIPSFGRREAASNQDLGLIDTVGRPVFRRVTYASMVGAKRLHPDAVRRILGRRAAAAGIKGTLMEPVTPHGMRSGFVTTAYANGVPDEEIMGSHPSSQPHNDAGLCPPGQTRQSESGGEAWVVNSRQSRQ
jgi:hypothetical protein